jgi:signal transduction histidine kinase/CheY-like chemotaxis protein
MISRRSTLKQRRQSSRAHLRAARRRIADLEVRLVALVRQLDGAQREALDERRKADEASRAKSTFLANMSHELRTPLNAVLGFAQLMERSPALGAQDRENLAAIMRGGEHLLGLVNDVLTLSKLESGTLAVAIHSFDLALMLRGVEEVIRSRAESKGLQFEAILDPSLPECVRGDEDRLRQVLMHLLGNAIDFTDTGGVTLRARWIDGEAVFEVEDTGKGIAPADMGVLFEMFVQAQSGPSSSEGIGLGLALTRNLVLVMDGDIFASSEVDKGTVFTVRVPLPADPHARRVDWQRIVGLEAGQEAFRVLVVDDVREDRVLLAGLLATAGFDVREVENGREAVDFWRTWRPHLIWMDARMRVMDGYEATRLIRSAESAEKTVPGAVATGSSESGSDRSVVRSLPLPDDPVATAPGTVLTRIIAVATPAFEHEREIAIANGADDFKVKPLGARDVFTAAAEQLGVRYLYANAERIGEVPTTVRESNEPAATRERLAELPHQVIAQLNRALTIGDDRLAREIVEWIGARDPQLADELDLLLRQFRFDEIAHLIESIPGGR